jgi:cation transport ATPase
MTVSRSYRLEELCCANCAARMEDAINRIDGVGKATVNFMTAKLRIEADESRLDEILDEAQRVCRKYEPDCIIVR